MKARRLIGAVATVLMAFCAAADTYTWTGEAGDCKWSTVGNWLDDVKPESWKSGEIYLSAANGGSVITNDYTSDIAISTLTLTNTLPVTLVGAKPLNMRSDGVPISTKGPAVFDQAFEFPTTAYWKHIYPGGSLTFNKELIFDIEQRMRICIRNGATVSGRVEFNAPITCGNLKLSKDVEVVFAPTPDLPFYFNDTVRLPVISLHNSAGQVYGDNGTLYVRAPMTYRELVVYNRSLLCEAEDVLCPSGMVRWVGGSYAGTLDINGFAQKAGTFGIIGDLPNQYNRSVLQNSGARATVTLYGGGSTTTWARVTGPIDLCYAPASSADVQTFAGREHDMTGTIVISNGTFEAASGTVWKNVAKMILAETGAFGVRDDNGGKNPTPALVSLKIGADAMLKLGTGAQMSAVVVTRDGTILTDGRYSGVAAEGVTKVDWIEGAGVLVVGAPAGEVYWKGAAGDGKWSSAGNWSGGVPTANSVVTIWGFDGDQAIAMSAGDTLPKSLRILNDGGISKVTVKDLDADWNSATVSIEAGGILEIGEGAAIRTSGKLWKIDGGELKINGGDLSALAFNYAVTSPFFVQGTESQTGRISVVSGAFHYQPNTWNDSNKLAVRTYGEIIVSGGTFDAPSKTWCVFLMEGGRFHVTGSGTYEMSPADGGRPAGLSVANGQMVFDGSAQLTVHQKLDFIEVVAPAGTSSFLAFRDQTTFVYPEADASLDKVVVGGSGPAVLELDMENPLLERFGTRTIVGTGFRKGELIMRRGYARSDYRGLIVGGASETNETVGGSGVFRLKNGVFDVPSNNKIDNEGYIFGCMVGEGGLTHATGKDLYRGHLEISGGALTNGGVTVIGGARSIGSVDQTGGVFYDRSSSIGRFVIGLMGGTGSYVLGGGRLEVSKPMYVGGLLTSCLSGYANLSPNYPVDAHDAVGTLTVTGGTLVCTGQVMVGMDGAGTIEVRGSTASISCASLVLSNTVETATSSTLRFTADANGISPITVADSVVNTPGTTMTVDLTEAPTSEKGYRLIGCTSWEGPVPACTFVGSADPEIHLVARQSGLYAKGHRGVVLIVR